MHGEKMNQELNNRLSELLKQRRLDVQTALQNNQLYEQRLLEAFPLERNSQIEYFYPNTFDGFDNEDYIVCHEIFVSKNWNEVDFNILFKKYVQSLILNENGYIYYLPAFLKYYYDLRFINSEFFDSILGKLSQGLRLPTSDQLQIAIQEHKYPAAPADFSAFEQLTPIQSKLVAVFLINVANLLPSEWFDSNEAQKALTNYWGKYLLI